jgi:hypothetical protein
MIVQATIKTEILAILNKSFNEASNPATVKNDFANDLATAIENAIKSAQLTIPSSAIVTVGSATTQTNAAPVTVINGLS